eukprot:6205634-Pleurochrysis_carterae.AAC.1
MEGAVGGTSEDANTSDGRNGQRRKPLSRLLLCAKRGRARHKGAIRKPFSVEGCIRADLKSVFARSSTVSQHASAGLSPMAQRLQPLIADRPAHGMP